MATQTPTKDVVNWTLFDAEIAKYYVDQKHSIAETQAYMEKNFGLKATVNQYKKRYAGYRNLKVSEWAGVNKAYAQRSQQGKASELLVRGKKMDPTRVSTQLARYQAQFSENDDAATPALHPRLSVRTPPSTITAVGSPLPPTSEIDIGPENGILLAPATSPVDMMNESVRDIASDSPPIPEAASYATMEKSATVMEGSTDMDANEWWLNMDFDFANFDFSTFDILDDSVPQRMKFLANLPWFELQSALCKRGAEDHRSPSGTSVSRSSSALAKVSVADRQALLAGLLGPPIKGASTTAVPTLTTKLSEILPEHLDGEAALAVHEFLDPTNKDPLQDLFKFACYFFSNNLLTREQRLAFMRWIMEKSYAQKLAAFLAIPETGVDGFRHGVISAIMDMENLRLVLLLVQSGVSFDDILAQSTGVRNPKFFNSLLEFGLDQDVFRQLSGRIGTLVLEQAMGSADEKLIVRLLNAPVSSGLLSGKSGGQLLRLVVTEGYLQATKILIQKGCELDALPHDGKQSTPLGLAVCLGHADIVKCLMKAGAKLDLVSLHDRWYEQPLAIAVKQGQMEIITALVEGGAGLDCRVSGFSDVFGWSSENNTNVYRHLCTLTGRRGALEIPKEKLTVAKIVEEADRGPGPFTVFHWEHRANLSDQLLEEALTLAVKGQKLDATSTLLSAGIDPNVPKTGSSKSLVDLTLWFKQKIAFEEPDHSILQVLLDSGADPNHEKAVESIGSRIWDCSMELEEFEMLLNGGLDVEKYGPRLLVDAVTLGKTDLIATLVEKGVSPNSYYRPHRGKTALQAAAGKGNVHYIDYFLQHGGDVNKPASRFGGRTALQAACWSHKTQTVQYLLAKGVDINAPPSIRDGITALEASLTKGKNTDLFELLLENGACIDQPSSHSGRILRRLIDQEGHGQSLLRLVSLTIDAGADSNEMLTHRHLQWDNYGYEIWSECGRTAVQLAAERGNLDTVKLLVSKNGDINRPAWRMQGRTALQAAASRDNPELELVQYLLDHKADVNASPAANGGLTALQGASIRGHVKIVLLLLGHGAEVNDSPALQNGRTALQGAAEHGRLDVVKVLLNAGARPDRWDPQGGFKKEIELAEKNRHFTVAELLRSHERELGEAGT